MLRKISSILNRHKSHYHNGNNSLRQNFSTFGEKTSLNLLENNLLSEENQSTKNSKHKLNLKSAAAILTKREYEIKYSVPDKINYSENDNFITERQAIELIRPHARGDILRIFDSAKKLNIKSKAYDELFEFHHTLWNESHYKYYNQGSTISVRTYHDRCELLKLLVECSNYFPERFVSLVNNNENDIQFILKAWSALKTAVEIVVDPIGLANSYEGDIPPKVSETLYHLSKDTKALWMISSVEGISKIVNVREQYGNSTFVRRVVEGDLSAKANSDIYEKFGTIW